MRYREITKRNAAFRILLSVALIIGCLLFSAPFAVTARAAEPTDVIEHFVITVDVQDDATLLMTYHIDWRVLDDVQYGPLEWVDIGIPNSHHSDVRALSDTIDHIEDNGSQLAIYLDREYHEDEVASFEFSFVQDHMYQIDRYAEGETAFIFTPAWFDTIDIEDMTIRWNAAKAGAWQPECMQEGDYLVFSTSLDAGDRYSITVAYPNDAFAFSVDRQADDGYQGGSNNYGNDVAEEIFLMILGFIGLILFIALPIWLIVKFVRWIENGFGFGEGSTRQTYEKKITRTKIEYYQNCPNCGAGRQEGRDDCAYCGTSMIKSREIVEEKDLDKPEKYRNAGTYHYGSSPDTYIHVNVVNVPVSRPVPRAEDGAPEAAVTGPPALRAARPAVLRAAPAPPAVRVPVRAPLPAARGAL